MTLPNERTQAIINTRRFLRELLDPKATPKVPRPIRLRALRCLRHYPNHLDLGDIRNSLQQLTKKEVDGYYEK